MRVVFDCCSFLLFFLLFCVVGDKRITMRSWSNRMCIWIKVFWNGRWRRRREMVGGTDVLLCDGKKGALLAGFIDTTPPSDPNKPPHHNVMIITFPKQPSSLPSNIISPLPNAPTFFFFLFTNRHDDDHHTTDKATFIFDILHTALST